ncbi:MAG: hypothetical protein TREMPRED_000009 [Tremellales sp. Tagirdzhanova-0007]|nr:MAG: hypothetical protein TREMPRED_000009 [Tremellales sp. Tagirdzhanova-0007]
MSVPTQVQTAVDTPLTEVGRLKLRGQHLAPITSAFPDLDKNGFAVVKHVITAEQAATYVDQAYAWLEGFGKGFDRNDRSTWKVDKLPAFTKGGLYNRHGSGHEQFAWDIRSEPGLIETFAKIWGTDELLVSFDGVNVSLPFEKDDLVDRAPWPHVDQSPLRRFKHCVQGIMNLYENGPNDGGLMVLEGSFGLYNAFFESHEDDAPPGGWDEKDSYRFDEKQLRWFYDRGCTWRKIEAEAGDVILWDSRCIHYGAAAEASSPRIATYVCYKPARDATSEIQQVRRLAMGNYDNTSHDPIMCRPTGSRINGVLTKDEQLRPRTLPVLSQRAKQLAGLVAY